MGERHPRDVWVHLLSETDRALDQDATLPLIGGGAIALGYDPKYLTTDLDTDRAIAPGVLAAVRVAQRVVQEERGFAHPPPVSATSISDVPYGYEERYRPVHVPGLRRLRVVIPERHDLALMKGSRGLEKDLVALAEMHRIEPFDLGTLLQRYGELQYTGSLERVQGSFLVLVDRLYGERVANALEPVLVRLDERRGLVSEPEWRRAAEDALGWERRGGGEPELGR